MPSRLTHVPVPNHPHLVTLSRSQSAPADLDEIIDVLKHGTDEEINAMAASRSVTASTIPRITPRRLVGHEAHGADPVVVEARRARLRSPNAKPERLTALVRLNAEPRKMPSEHDTLAELEALLAEADPDFAKLDIDAKRDRVKQLRWALKDFIPTVAAARAAAVDKPVLLLSAFPGRNRTERAIAFMRATDPKFPATSWESQCRVAREIIEFFGDRIV